MSEEQTVVKTEGEANVAQEGNNAQGNDIDALLSDYANSGEPKDPAPADKKPPLAGTKDTEKQEDTITSKEILNEIKHLREERRNATI